ncbi:MAG: PaaI family thioesterase [Actinomycetota bacterium]
MVPESADVDYANTIHETLGVRMLEMTPDRVVLELDVTPAVHQPMGLLHGGVSAVIAESAASLGAYLNCIQGEQYAVGIDLNITHLRAKREGTVTATATPIRKGRGVHVWGVDVVGEDGRNVAVARCTLAIRSIDQPV